MLSLIDQLFGAHNFPFLAMFAPFFIIAYIGIAIVAGLFWTPIGASVCALIAWRRGLSPYRFAVAGAVYSALFFLPWAYLAARMLGWVIPKPLAALPYVVLYASWLQGPAQFSYDMWDWGNDEAYPGALWLFAWLGNMFTMAASLLLMTPIEKVNPFYRARRDAPLLDTLPNPVYLLPFALLWGWTVALFALTVLPGGAAG